MKYIILFSLSFGLNMLLAIDGPKYNPFDQAQSNRMRPYVVLNEAWHYNIHPGKDKEYKWPTLRVPNENDGRFLQIFENGKGKILSKGYLQFYLVNPTPKAFNFLKEINENHNDEISEYAVCIYGNYSQDIVNGMGFLGTLKGLRSLEIALNFNDDDARRSLMNALVADDFGPLTHLTFHWCGFRKNHIDILVDAMTDGRRKFNNLCHIGFPMNLLNSDILKKDDNTNVSTVSKLINQMKKNKIEGNIAGENLTLDLSGNDLVSLFPSQEWYIGERDERQEGHIILFDWCPVSVDDFTGGKAGFDLEQKKIFGSLATYKNRMLRRMGFDFIAENLLFEKMEQNMFHNWLVFFQYVNESMVDAVVLPDSLVVLPDSLVDIQDDPAKPNKSLELLIMALPETIKSLILKSENYLSSFTFIKRFQHLVRLNLHQSNLPPLKAEDDIGELEHLRYLSLDNFSFNTLNNETTVFHLIKKLRNLSILAFEDCQDLTASIVLSILEKTDHYIPELSVLSFAKNTVREGYFLNDLAIIRKIIDDHLKGRENLLQLDMLDMKGVKPEEIDRLITTYKEANRNLEESKDFAVLSFENGDIGGYNTFKKLGDMFSNLPGYYENAEEIKQRHEKAESFYLKANNLLLTKYIEEILEGMQEVHPYNYRTDLLPLQKKSEMYKALVDTILGNLDLTLTDEEIKRRRCLQEKFFKDKADLVIAANVESREKFFKSLPEQEQKRRLLKAAVAATVEGVRVNAETIKEKAFECLFSN